MADSRSSALDPGGQASRAAGKPDINDHLRQSDARLHRPEALSPLSLIGSRTSAALASRLVWPMAAVLIAMMVLVVGTMLWTSESANHIAAEKQKRQIAEALENASGDRLRHLTHVLRATGFPQVLNQPDATERLRRFVAARGAAYLTYNSIFLVNTNGDLLAGEALAESPSTAFRAMYPLVQRALADLTGVPGSDSDLGEATGPGTVGTARVVYHRGELWAVSARMLPAINGRPRAIAIAHASIEQQDLDAIGARLSAAKVRVTTVSPRDIGDDQLALPLLGANGSSVATLVWRPERPGDTIRERLLPTTLLILVIASILALAIFWYVQRVTLDLMRREEQAHRMALHDPLSGLPNRLLFTSRLEQELARIKRGGDGIALLYLDLDRFKAINDGYGHEAGDAIIRAVGQRLSDLLRGSDTLARLGGDEFVIIQTGVKEPREAQALARRVLDAMAKPFDIAEGSVTLGASIGIALSPQNGIESDALIRIADTALYQAKAEGRNRYSFFDHQMDEALRLRKIVEDDLRAAIADNALVLHYQPQFSAVDKTMVTVEALVRWPHAQHGLIAPDQFIAIAEERGLIVPLGEWVLRRACADAKRWPDLRIAVNVSPVQFRHPDFVPSVLRIVSESGLDPARLELELTEGVLVADADAAEAAMMDLRAHGIRMALDDFGTGYSSLIYLRRFPFDKIKIDRSFLESMETTGESAILVHSVVHLGRALGLTVTAEGVETEEQLHFLQALGCHLLQGYLLSKPVPAADIDRMLGGRARTAALPSGVA